MSSQQEQESLLGKMPPLDDEEVRRRIQVVIESRNQHFQGIILQYTFG